MEQGRERRTRSVSKRKVLKFGWVLGLICLLLPLILFSSTASAREPDLQLGAFLPDPSQVGAFESNIQHQTQVFLWYQSIIEDFNVTDLGPLAESGRTIQLSWEPRDPSGDPVDQPAYSLAAIINGDHDAAIHRWAQQLRDFGYPVMFRPMCEMNGDWTSWSGTVNGNSPEEYIPAWIHIHDIFVQEGANNVEWVWSPNRDGSAATAQSTFGTYYPGDAYVDYIGMNGYNWGTLYPEWGSVWQDLEEVFGYSYDVAAANTSKSIIIAETASTEVGGDKALWIRSAFKQLPIRFPRVSILTWFNMNKETDWRVESSAASLDAFRWGAATLDDRSYYLSWYDNNPTWGMNGDWVMISNPGSVATTVELYLGNTSGYPYPIDTFNLAPGGHVEWQAPQTTTAGPVRVVSTNGQPLVVSQRVLFRNSFNEVAALNGDQLESKYYFSWYDSNSGFADWIMIHNPDQVNSVYYEVRVGGVVRASSTIAAGDMATPSFTALTAGPVVVEAWTDSSKSAPANITASERVTYNGSLPSGSFSEIEGTPASRISSQYYWTTYDDVSYSDWVLVANPNASSIYYELKVAGLVRASSTIAAGEVAAPIIPGLSAGPVELRTWTNSSKTTPANSIASQRIFKASANTFEEVPGTPVAELSSNYFWTWYDQASAGVYDWMVLVNPQTSGNIRAEVWIGGIKKSEQVLTPGVFGYAYFPGLSGGPVEIRAYRDGGLWSNPADRRSIVASHRVLWNNYFNELMGGLLN